MGFMSWMGWIPVSTHARTHAKSRPPTHPGRHQSPRYHSVIAHDHPGPQLNGDPFT